MRYLVARYRRGEHEEVWRDLRALGDLDGAARAEAIEVGCETMKPVAANADDLADRLQKKGWVPLFGVLAAGVRDSTAG